MVDRETIFPLLIGAVLAVFVHVALVPSLASSLVDQDDAREVGADLVVSEVDVPSSIRIGQEIDLIYTITNRGDLEASARSEIAADGENAGGTLPWFDRVYLSKDDVLDESDRYLAERMPFALGAASESHRGEHESPEITGLAAGSSYSDALRRIKLDITQPGLWHIIVVADVKGAVAESNKKNNVSVVPIEVLPAASDSPEIDLKIADLTTPGKATVGQAIKIMYSVVNQGKDAADRVWLNRVYLSRDGNLSDDDALLTASNMQNLEAGIESGPVYFEGAFYAGISKTTLMYIIVKADAEDEITETDETNNTAVAVIAVKPAELDSSDAVSRGDKTDLEMVTIRSPANAVNGERIELDYLVINRGMRMTAKSLGHEDGELVTPFWKDRVYLSADDQLSEEDQELAATDNAARLKAGGSYWGHVEMNIRMPDEFKGRMWLIVKTDSDETILESREDNNTKAVPIDINTITIGKEKHPKKVTVAWIAHDDFRELIARERPTLQPAVQSQVDPIANAPVPVKPTPAAQPLPRPQLVEFERLTPALQPSVAQVQRTEVDSLELPVKSPPADAPLLARAKPVNQPKAVSPVVSQLSPKPLVPAQGPQRNGVPVTQPHAKADAVTDSPPTKSPESTLPSPILPIPAPLAQLSKVDSLDPVSKQPATADVTAPGPGTIQDRAETLDPKTGLPTQQIPTQTKNDKNPTGPNNVVPSKTDKPSIDGLPVKAPDVRGDENADPKLARSGDRKGIKPAADNKNQLKPKRPNTRPVKANPTSAPRSDGDSPPTTLVFKPVRVQPGKVITRPGIEIVTAIPDISVASRLISGPTARNPKARVTFDRTGKVKRVILLKSTGHVNMDSPIIDAFYRFKAKGKALKQVRDTFDMEITVLLR